MLGVYVLCFGLLMFNFTVFLSLTAPLLFAGHLWTDVFRQKVSYSFTNMTTTGLFTGAASLCCLFSMFKVMLKQHCCHIVRPDVNIPPNSLHCLPSSRLYVSCVVKSTVAVQYALHINTFSDHLTLIWHIILNNIT